MTFTEQHLAALRLISDTFAPGDGSGVPAASAVGAPEFALEVAGTNPRKAELNQLKTLLRLWDTRLLGLLLTGRPRKFSELDRAGRERVLLSLSDSRLAAKRALFAALKGAALAPYYITGGPPCGTRWVIRALWVFSRTPRIRDSSPSG